MRRLASITGFLFVLAVLAGTAGEPADPDLVFETTELDFGRAPEGQRAPVLFRFRNAGGGDLRIHRIEPTCACTIAPLERDTYAPGEEGILTAWFDTTGRQGYQETALLVYSNDAGERTDGEPNLTRLTITGEIYSLYEVMPPVLSLPDVLRGSGAQATIAVRPSRAEEAPPFAVLKVESADPALEVRVVASQGGADLQVRLLPVAPVGYLDSTVVLTTDQAEQPRIRVRVVARVLGHLYAEPARLALGAFRRGALPGQRAIAVGARRGEGVRVIGVDVPEGAPLELDLLPEVEGRRWRLAPRVRAGAAPGPFLFPVRVYFDHPEEPVKTVLVEGEVLPEVVVDPAAVWFDAAPRPEEALVVATLRLRLGDAGGTVRVRPLEIEGLRAVLGAGEGPVVQVELLPGAPPGEVSGLLVLETGFPGEEEVRLPLRGIVREAP